MFGFLLFCAEKDRAGSVAELTAWFTSSDEKGSKMVSSRLKI